MTGFYVIWNKIARIPYWYMTALEKNSITAKFKTKILIGLGFSSKYMQKSVASRFN